MTDERLDAIRQMIRSELRRCELQPPPPTGPGAWRWGPAGDCWISLVDAPVGPPASPSA